MGTRILEKGDVVKGGPLVQPNDDLFWFSRPRFVLSLIHFVLFENAFQIALFAWSWLKFGYPSCYHKNIEDLLIRIAMGIVTQVLCSYVTLPFYALVTQMGSNMKPVIFGDDVAAGLRGWQESAKKQAKEGRKSNDELLGVGRERPSASSNHHDFRERKDRLSETSVVEIERDVENPSSLEMGYIGQQEVDNRSSEFSFGKNDSSKASK